MNTLTTSALCGSCGIRRVDVLGRPCATCAAAQARLSDVLEHARRAAESLPAKRKPRGKRKGSRHMGDPLARLYARVNRRRANQWRAVRFISDGLAPAGHTPVFEWSGPAVDSTRRGFMLKNPAETRAKRGIVFERARWETWDVDVETLADGRQVWATERVQVGTETLLHGAEKRHGAAEPSHDPYDDVLATKDDEWTRVIRRRAAARAALATNRQGE